MNGRFVFGVTVHLYPSAGVMAIVFLAGSDVGFWSRCRENIKSLSLGSNMGMMELLNVEVYP